MDEAEKRLLVLTDEYQGNISYLLARHSYQVIEKKIFIVIFFKERVEETPFLYLTLDLPSAPLYRDEFMQNIIPQVPLGNLLAKFNGVTEKEYKTYKENIMKRFELTRLPRFLIIYIKRFTKNQWFVEKNPTIVNFPIK